MAKKKAARKKTAKKKAAKKKTATAKKKAAKPEAKYEGGVYLEAGFYYPVKTACVAIGKSPTWTRNMALDSGMGKLVGEKFLVISEDELKELEDIGTYDCRV